MKEMIVVVGMIILGCMIFDMIIGDANSLKTASGEKFKELLLFYQE